MKINFSQKIIGPDGKELDLHLGQVALNALNAPEKEPLSLDAAIKRGNLGLMVADGGEHDVTPEEASLIRSLLPKIWSPVVVARAAKMLEG